MRSTLAVLLLGVFGACGSAAIAQGSAMCGAAYANSASTVFELRSITEACDLYSEGYARALYRLNTFAPPDTAPRLAPRDRIDGVQMHRAVFEADVFFNWLEAYPIDIGLDKLAELVGLMNSGFLIEQIQITSSMDPVESELPSVEVAARRADFLRRYFLAAGAESRRIVVATRKPIHPNTFEGRARDRTAALRVVILRQRAEPRQ